MRLSLQNTNNPLDADLEKVLPGVHERLLANHAAIVSVDRKLGAKLENMTESMTNGLQQLHAVLVQNRSETDELVGRSLVQAGNNLLQGSPTATDTMNETEEGFLNDSTGLNESAGQDTTTSPTQVEDHISF